MPRRNHGRGHAAGYASSGSCSEHEAALSGLAHSFLEDDGATPPASESDCGEECDDSDGGHTTGEAAEEVRELLDLGSKGGTFRIRLYGDVVVAVEAMAALRLSRSGFRRAVMARLREEGYKAGVCKARWEGPKGMAEGNYEYIDVEVEEKRCIMDVGFASEFEVARSTAGYRELAAVMPDVARPEEVRIAADEARRSLRRQWLSVPQWRKRRFMITKCNPVPPSAGEKAAGGGVGEVKCRAVGFVESQRRESWFAVNCNVC